MRLACLQSLVTDIDTAPTEMPADMSPPGLPAVVAISVGVIVTTTKEDAVTAVEPMVEVIAMVMPVKAIGGMPAATTEMAIAAEVTASAAASAKTAASQVAATHVTTAAEGAASVAAAMAASAKTAAAEAAATTPAASAAPFGEGIVG